MGCVQRGTNPLLLSLKQLCGPVSKESSDSKSLRSCSSRLADVPTEGVGFAVLAAGPVVAAVMGLLADSSKVRSLDTAAAKWKIAPFEPSGDGPL